MAQYGTETTAHMFSSEVYSLFAVIIRNIAVVNNNNYIYTCSVVYSSGIRILPTAGGGYFLVCSQ
jgi:hypothetical protein